MSQQEPLAHEDDRLPSDTSAGHSIEDSSPGTPDWLPPPPPVPAEMHLPGKAGAKGTGFQRIIKKLDPVIAKTLLDLDACRRVVSRLVSDKEEQVAEMMYRQSPSEASMIPPAVTRFRKATPCSARWENMSGSERFRECSVCKLYMYDTKGMTLEQVQEMVLRWESKKDPQFWRRADGRFLTADCPVGRAEDRRRVIRVSAISAAACGVVALAVILPPMLPKLEIETPKPSKRHVVLRKKFPVKKRPTTDRAGAVAQPVEEVSLDTWQKAPAELPPAEADDPAIGVTESGEVDTADDAFALAP